MELLDWLLCKCQPLLLKVSLQLSNRIFFHIFWICSTIWTNLEFSCTGWTLNRPGPTVVNCFRGQISTLNKGSNYLKTSLNFVWLPAAFKNAINESHSKSEVLPNSLLSESGCYSSKSEHEISLSHFQSVIDERYQQCDVCIQLPEGGENMRLEASSVWNSLLSVDPFSVPAKFCPGSRRPGVHLSSQEGAVWYATGYGSISGPAWRNALQTTRHTFTYTRRWFTANR